MNRSVRGEVLTAGPYALLAFASLVSADPIVAVAGSLGTNLLAPYLGLAWKRQCHRFLAEPELRNTPLQGALRQAIIKSVSSVQRQWQNTPDGQIARRSFLEPRSAAAQQTEAAFSDLRTALLTAASAEGLALLLDARFQTSFGENEKDTVEVFRQYLLTDLGQQMDPPLAQFVAARLPVAIARAFSSQVFDRSPAAEPVRYAFDRLTQNLQLTLLQDIELNTAQQAESQQALQKELNHLRAIDQAERDQVAYHLQDMLAQQQAIWEEVNRLASSLTYTETSKARVVPASGLQWGITGPRVDIRVPAWIPQQEQTLPWEQEAASILAEQRVLVIKGKPSAGKTHLAGKLMRSTPNRLVIIPRVSSGSPPTFTETKLVGHEVILFLDDLHERAETFDVLAWWANLEETCGTAATRLLVTARGGDQWDRLSKAFLDSLPSGSVFEVPTLSSDDSARIGHSLGIDADVAKKRFEGTIGSLVLDFSEMSDEYDRMAREEHDGVYSSRLLDAAKILHKMRQPVIREETLRQTCVDVLGEGRAITDERWNHLVAQTSTQGFGRFDEGIFETYAPYLERDDVVKFRVEERHLRSVASVLLKTPDAESAFYLGLAAQIDWHNQEIAQDAYQHGMMLGHPLATFMIAELLLLDADRAGAKQAFKRGMELDNGVAALNYGLICEEDGDLREAKRAFKRGMELDDHLSASKYGEILLMEGGAYEEAEWAYRRAWELRGYQ